MKNDEYVSPFRYNDENGIEWRNCNEQGEVEWTYESPFRAEDDFDKGIMNKRE